jgi:ubiquitin-protein ligase
MEQDGSYSDESGMIGQEIKDSVIAYLERFKVKIAEFSEPNLAKNLAESSLLTPSQMDLLENLTEFTNHPYINKETFISLIRETSDIRSFRVLLGQQSGSLYDYSLLCLDIYFHSFTKPSVVLRTGMGQATVSFYFQDNGLISDQVWTQDIAELPDPSCENYLERILYSLHSLLFVYDNCESIFQLFPQYNDKAVPEHEITAYQNLLKYTCAKYGILENLKNPLPEFSEATKAYNILFKENIKLYLDVNLIVEGSVILFPEDSLSYSKNQALTKNLQQIGYYRAQLDLYTEIKAILDMLPSAKDEYGIDCTTVRPVVLTEATQNDPQPPESRTLYFQTLKDCRFSNADFWSKKKHVLSESIAAEGVVNTNRLSKEVKVLSQHLPCEMTGAIFVVMDSERMDLMKALISGSEDTPYTHGLYEFHIACPPEYPKKPPSVSIVTTGSGKVRFNPNLYDDGYVCLSVINTWDGDPSERWNPAHSNILQVLLSIQVLVMDNMIIQKEPEFEHLSEDSWENKMYSNIVRYNNVKYAMLGMLENPPEEFKEVIAKHFALKRNSIMHTVDKWLEQAKDFITPSDGEIDYLVMDHNPHTCNIFKSYSYYSVLLEARNELLKKLDSLPAFGLPKEEFPLIEITEDLAKLGGYYKKMNGFMIIDKELAEAGGFRHQLGMHLQSYGKYNENIERFNKEFLDLKQLKCMPNSSIFIVRDSTRWDLLKILISGPINTDYSNGLFLFDVVCPVDFPESPPKIILLTTGRYNVNFHPRLLKSGEVIGLQWTPQSNLADYFSQVQNIFKQPNSTENSLYNSCLIRYNTMQFAILDMIKHPPIDFSAAVASHFEIKKRDILLQAESWIDESTTIEVVPDTQTDNLSTAEVFIQFGVSGAMETVFSEIVEIIGDVIGSDWSDSAKEVEKENKPKKVKPTKKSNYPDLYSDSGSSSSEKKGKIPKKDKSIEDKSSDSDSSVIE